MKWKKKEETTEKESVCEREKESKGEREIERTIKAIEQKEREVE